jgi:hypothetical protein
MTGRKGRMQEGVARNAPTINQMKGRKMFRPYDDFSRYSIFSKNGISNKNTE